MAIEINNFDYKFFIKNQFILNVIMSAFVGFVLFAIEIFVIKVVMSALTLFYAIYLLFMFLKDKGSRDIINYARYRVMSYLFVCLSFLFLSLGFASLISIFYFLGYLIIFLVIGAFMLYAESRSNKFRYDHLLEEYYSSEEKHSLFYFFAAIADSKQKTTYLSYYLMLFAVQIGVVVGLNVGSCFNPNFKIKLMIGLFFFLSCLFLNQMRTYILIPYRFLLKKQKALKTQVSNHKEAS